jgi:hypothetical protein
MAKKLAGPQQIRLCWPKNTRSAMLELFLSIPRLVEALVSGLTGL